MNERIKQLAKQTGFRYDNGEWHFGDDSDVEKFAELIVRECANIAFDEYAATDGADSGESAILKHFGVE